MAGDRVKMLLPSISNTICKCLSKTFNFVNTDKSCCKKANPCEKKLLLRGENKKIR